jgi:hypothetical protein
MKFINYLTSIAGVGIFPLISLLLFFAFFLFLAFYLMKGDKNRFGYVAALPNEGEDQDANNKQV